jgi:hypothetical protein
MPQPSADLTIRLVIAFIINCVGFVLPGQAQDATNQLDVFVGSWQGIITQVDGPTIRYFDMELTISPEQSSDSTYNVSSHVMDGKYHAYIVGKGFLRQGDQLYIREDSIIRSDTIPGMEWCIKQLLLTSSMEKGDLHLRGKWLGDTSFGTCQPGEMDLVRQVIRP